MSGNDADVDALTASMSSTMEVTPNNTFGEHPRYAMFKNYGKMAESQRNRREEWLQKQNEARDERRNRNRALSSSEGTAEAPKAEEGFMEVDHRRRRRQSSSTATQESRGGRRNYYRDDMKGRLMYSEWLIDVPADLQQDWVMIPAPSGKRVLVLAENQYTYIYDKRGTQLSRFKSGLNTKAQTTLVDGILARNTVYVLDYLVTNNCELESCEFDCRRVMGSSFLREAGIFEEGNGGQFRFVELEAVECSPEAMTEALSKEFAFDLDGLLFYYSKVHYTSGQTPLVGWLKPWMLPEILGVPVADVHKKDARPSPQEFITDFARKHPNYGLPISRKEARRISENQMDDEGAAQEVGATVSVN